MENIILRLEPAFQTFFWVCILIPAFAEVRTSKQSALNILQIPPPPEDRLSVSVIVSTGDARRTPCGTGNAPCAPCGTGNAPYAPCGTGNAPYAPVWYREPRDISIRVLALLDISYNGTGYPRCVTSSVPEPAGYPRTSLRSPSSYVSREEKARLLVKTRSHPPAQKRVRHPKNETKCICVEVLLYALYSISFCRSSVRFHEYILSGTWREGILTLSGNL